MTVLTKEDYLPEQEVWEEGVYMLKETDPVLGGISGIDNLPLKHLANRTRYLKKQMEKGEEKRELAFKELVKPDGYKLVGRCKSVAELRTIRPTEHGQRILVEAYHEGMTVGGGEWTADLSGVIKRDDGVKCVVLPTGEKWINTKVNLHAVDYGVVGNGSFDDTSYVIKYINDADNLHKDFSDLTLNYISTEPLEIKQHYYVESGKSKWHKIVYEFNNTKFARTTNLKVNGAHGVDLYNFDCPTAKITIDGLYWGNFYNCRFQELHFGERTGSTSRFKSNSWCNFVDCTLQQIFVNEQAIWTNAITFVNIAASGQKTLDYFLRKRSSANMQNWMFRGGDISYHTQGVHIVEPQGQTTDFEVTYDGIYFDSKLPEPLTFNKAYVHVINTHSAQKFEHAIPLNYMARYVFQGHNGQRPITFDPITSVNLVKNGDLSTLYNNLNHDLFTTAEHTTRDISNGEMCLVIDGNATKYTRGFDVGNAKGLTMLAVVSSTNGTEISAGLTGTSDAQFPKIYSKFSIPAGGEPYIITMTSPVVDNSASAGVSLENNTANNYKLHYLSCVGGSKPLLDVKGKLKILHSAQITINQTQENKAYIITLSNEHVKSTSKVLNSYFDNVAGLNVTMEVVPKQGELVFIFNSADGQPFNLGYIKIETLLEV
ncbi:hypothetical protein [Actinobacillus minor]|uniref:hypothetical protein n=1 Tax=Actinobacillus minor TaxID=51047 RepID=UPI0023F3C397|nr:hypothetical protein [Actinobacillus minor]MDD6910228.1 hypothetical protein [Actinobacillus minor]